MGFFSQNSIKANVLTPNSDTAQTLDTAALAGRSTFLVMGTQLASEQSRGGGGGGQCNSSHTSLLAVGNGIVVLAHL